MNPPPAPIRFIAEIRNENAIWFDFASVNSLRSLDIRDYSLTNAAGESIPISSVVPLQSTDALIVPLTPIDITRVYYLSIPEHQLRTLCRFDGWFRSLYSAKRLGAHIDPIQQTTTFRIFSPRATSLQLYLYDTHSPDEHAKSTFEMQRDSAGVWEYVVPHDLHGTYYDFTVHGPDDPGNSFFETHPVHISDPYARVSVDSFGRCRVWRPTRPATPLVNGRPKMEDVVAYEVHVQDFTDRLPIDDRFKGTFEGMRLRGLKNQNGEAVGFDYLLQLGINVVHLLPVQEFLHYPDDEWQDAFKDDPFMIEQGIDREYYEWGYRTSHAFAIECRYRIKGSEHGSERDQFRDLVQAFHDHGIAVIVDLVPNHTAENMDGRTHLLHFNVLDKPFYYRTNNDLRHIGPFGNEVKTEDRPMVQRWLIDQCRELIDEFGIDGFRIDLAGQIDKQSLLKLRVELGEDVIIYGEPWIPPSDPDVAHNPRWSWTKKDAPITFFQDDARNAFGSPTSDPVDKQAARGFAGGDESMRPAAMKGLLNSFEEEIDPNRGINYLDIHDNWTLADRFATQHWDGRLGVDEGPLKIAVTLLMTSLGPIVLHGGSEMLRSKGLGGVVSSIRHTRTGSIHFHGMRDSYNLRNANHFVWENLGTSRCTGANCDYSAMVDWWRSMIALRNSELGKVFRIGTAPEADYYHWILPKNERLLGYVVARKVLVLINTDEQEGTFEVNHPMGPWSLIGNNQQVDHVAGIQGEYQQLHGRHSVIRTPPQSVRLWKCL